MSTKPKPIYTTKSDPRCESNAAPERYAAGPGNPEPKFLPLRNRVQGILDSVDHLEAQACSMRHVLFGEQPELAPAPDRPESVDDMLTNVARRLEGLVNDGLQINQRLA